MNKINSLLAAFLILSVVGCRDPYTPEINSTDISYLVVEGVLNASAGGVTNVRLTRTSKLDNRTNVVAELNAQVQVEGKDNSIKTLNSIGNGVYSSPDLQLLMNNEYRVRIRTSNGKEYLSAYTTAKKTPVIDSIGWKKTGDGLVVHANAHDDAGTTRYYRWEYDETWEIWSRYYSKYIYENARVRLRNMPDEERFYCWKYNSSKNIIIGSSAKLQSDRISQAQLTLIGNGDERPAIRYSIMVRQYSMDKEAYEFYELMKKNTESIGTIFDPQPSEVTGNIQSVSDPTEPVIGYITACTVEEKRIFINATQVPDWRFVQDCPSIEVTLDSIVFYFEGGGFGPYDAKIDQMSGNVELYYGSYGGCIDCTKRGGNLNKPSYW